ncbi:MAG: hypothetical protein KAS32_18920 [Candidatus Peribacteraceae bacterium]|nr:hypothetical protein [Candidatus Peribacteraceae bacterium]
MSTGSMDWIGPAIEGSVGIGEIVAGALIQSETQEKIKKWREQYPKMDIPEAIVSATDLYAREAQRTQVAGYDLYQQQIGQKTAQGVTASREAATSAADLLGATTSLYGQQSQALTQLEIEGARQQAQSKQQYGQQLNVMGQWQQQQYYMNQYTPWVSRMNELQGIQQSAYDMLVGGINTLASSGASMGGGTSPTTTAGSLTGDQDVLSTEGNYNYDFTSSFA